LFAPLRNWLLGPPRLAKDAFVAVPAADPVEAAGWDILSLRPRRLEILEETRDLLIGVPMKDRRALVDRVASRFAAYVGDLPASEKSHASQEYGLLDHSLEVARATVGELVRPSFRVSEDPAANYREQPVWAYSGFVLGLLHDLGRLFDLDVLPKGTQTPWSPRTESLLIFLKRLGMQSSGRGAWRWHPGRGQNKQVQNGNGLVPVVLPLAAKELLGIRLRILLSVFERSYAEGKEDWGQGPAGQVVQTVRKWDRTLAKDERQAKHPPQKPGLAKPAPSVPTPPASTTAEPVVAGDDIPPSPPVAAPAEPRSAAVPASPQANPGPASSPIAPAEKLPAPQSAPGPDREALIRAYLDPTKLIETIRSWVRAGKSRRNCPKADFFVCSEFLWLRYPQGFISLLEGSHINWSGTLGERLLAVLLKHPQVAPLDSGTALVRAIPMPHGKEEIPFVRIRTAGFLPEPELASLGFWAPGIKVAVSAVPETAIEERR
jgi:hypothetical protein